MNAAPHRQEPLPERYLDAVLELWRRSEGRVPLPVNGNSMLPLLRDGDRLLVSHAADNIRRGDILVFRQGGELIAHRVISQRRDQAGTTFITKGDNVWRPDPAVRAGDVLGRAFALQREGRQLAMDTAAWRWSGWLIATLALPWIWLYPGLSRVKRRLWGSRPSRPAGLLKNALLRLSSIPIKIFALVLARSGRWRPAQQDGAHEG